ncbi:MAG: hypothetical protein JOZ29_00725, partial [Deltaproteobacteria bacterium]|nr:hypothetical protein [Deltaproteobacteria bacterium]
KPPRGHGGIYINDGYPWNIKITNGRLLYVYPWGSSLLSLPVVALFNAARFRVAPHPKYNGDNELRMQAIIATSLCAITIWVVYETAGYLLPMSWSLAIALGTAFGTPIWSSASRSLWPQTWAVLLTTLAIWMLLSGSIRPLLLGTVLAWSCLVRPQVLPDVAAITGYVLIRHERWFFWRYVAAGASWTIPVCVMMWFFTGGFFSALYSPGMLDFPHQFWPRLYGVLLSPSRGLLVFSPVTLVPLYLIIRYWKVLPERRLAVLAIVIIAMHLVLLSSWVTWWGGGSYGPRLLLEAVPWFVLLAILGIRAFLEDYSLSVRRRLVMGSIAALALAASIATNAPGALAANSIGWRHLDNQHLGALWDWHDPQFLCWILRPQN